MKTLLDLKESAYDWAIIPDDLPKENLILITAKTTHSTFHYTDPKYKIRKFTPQELKEAARSLAKRPSGRNHRELILLNPNEQTITGNKYAFTVDAQWNESTQAVEALVFYPIQIAQLVRQRQNTDNPVKFSVEYTWRDEKREGDEVEFIGLIFDRVDLLDGLSAGDKFTSSRLVEGQERKGLMEAEFIQDELVTDSVEDPSLNFFKELEESATSFLDRLGEPFAGYKDFDDCKAKNQDKKDPAAYCGYIKHQIEDKGKEGILVFKTPKDTVTREDEKKADKEFEEGTDKGKEASALSKIPEISVREANLTGRKEPQIPEAPVNTMTTEEPSKLPVATDISDSQKHSNVTSVGAVADDKGPITPTPADTNPDKNLNQEPSKQDLPEMDSKKSKEGKDLEKSIPIKGADTPTETLPIEPDKTIQDVEHKLQETQDDKTGKTQEDKENKEPKKEDKSKEPNKPEQTSNTAPTPEVPKDGTLPDPKDTRIKELEGAVTTLQENAKKFDTEKDKAIKEAELRGRDKVINKVREVLPSSGLVSSNPIFNATKRLADDVNKKLYEAQNEG